MIFTEKAWRSFVADEIAAISLTLSAQGITLDKEQPHVAGERYLMSGKKVVLVGKNRLGETVIVKTSADKDGKAEIRKERNIRDTITNIAFAYQPLLTPDEIWYHEKNGRIIIVTEYIDQPKPYLQLSDPEQFELILGAFTMLEGVHATTKSHQPVAKKLGQKQVDDYLHAAETFVASITDFMSEDDSLAELLTTALTELRANQNTITQFCGFLTHDDFALHNFRFKDGAIYLIDQSSLLFGNKHESWARFMNYMTLYNPTLEAAILRYARDNRSNEEQASLRLMRIYKLLELLTYHAGAAQTKTENVRLLSQARVSFWSDVLRAVLENRKLEPSITDQYKKTRDQLRSPSEIKRQQAIQQLPN